MCKNGRTLSLFLLKNFVLKWWILLMDDKIIIYRTEDLKGSGSFEETEFKLTIWRPSLWQLIPPEKNPKYILYWLFHYLGIFGNSRYTALLLYHGGTIIASLLIVPAYFKWPFMAKGDVQFTYVKTTKAFRGRGIASNLLRAARKSLDHFNGNIWYVTNTQNIASRRVASSLGFTVHSMAKKKGSLIKRLVEVPISN